MKKLNPDLYVEAFGVVFRKVVKDDCRKTLASILSKQQEKELIETLFQPAIEMMDACAKITLHEENPFYLPLDDDDEKGNEYLLHSLFYVYYDITGSRDLSSILTGFEKDWGKAFLEAVFSLNEEIQDPIHYVLYCECRSELKVALLTILQDHERWIKDFLATMEEVAVKIAPIMDAHRHLYAYLDQFLHTKEAYDRLLKRIGFPLAEDMPVIASLSACNMANVQGTQRGDRLDIVCYIGILLCAVDFFIPSDFDEEQMSEHLKMLADPTKFAILMILKEGPAYQSELARRLSLTTATISHHLGQLYQNGFVGSMLQGKMVYYVLQQDMIDHTIEQLKRYFTKQ